jgi:hypothetical protein
MTFGPFTYVDEGAPDLPCRHCGELRSKHWEQFTGPTGDRKLRKVCENGPRKYEPVSEAQS